MPHHRKNARLPGAFPPALLWMRRSLLFVPIAVLAALLCGASISAHRAASEQAQAERTFNAALDRLFATQDLELTVRDMVSTQRAFLLTRDPALLRTHLGRRTQILDRLATIEAQSRGELSLRQALSPLRGQLGELFRRLDDSTRLRESGDLAHAHRAGFASHQAFARVVRHIEALKKAEQASLLRLHSQAKNASERNGRNQDAVTAIGLILLLTTIAAALLGERAHARVRAATRELAHRAATDPMTGLPNRGAFMSALAGTIASGEPFSLVLLDIDHFKAVNDRYGHPAGDHVIRSVGAMMREALPREGLVARFGGEEYAILLPRASCDEVRMTCERIRRQVEGHGIAVDRATRIQVTISVGIAHHMPGEGADSVIARADQALYRAKHGGRNQVQLAA